MTKVVYNQCFGGFSLSDKAVRRYGELKGVEILSEGTYYYVEDGRRNYFWYWDIERDDPALVRVVEEMGEEADGRYADLVVVDIPAGTRYRIREYDGREWIETEDEIDWRVA